MSRFDCIENVNLNNAGHVESRSISNKMQINGQMNLSGVISRYRLSMIASFLISRLLHTKSITSSAKDTCVFNF